MAENMFGGNNCFLPDGTPCKFCCPALAIHALNKAEDTHCQHECDSGCSLHATHQKPAECDEYFCGSDPNYKRLLLIFCTAARSRKLTPEVTIHARKACDPPWLR